MTPQEENKLVIDMLPIVYRVIKQLNIRGEGCEDAKQEGRIALMTAIRTFKPASGATLTTWAYAKVGWRLRTWLCRETRQRTGWRYVGAKGAQGNESCDWAPVLRDARVASISGTGDDLLDLCYPHLVEADDKKLVTQEEEEKFAPDLRILHRALRDAEPPIRRAGESILRGESIKQHMAAEGKGSRTIYKLRKEARMLFTTVKKT